MLIRISLIVAIIAALAGAGLNFFLIKDKIIATQDERDKNARDRDFERSEKVKAQKLAKETQTKLDKTTEELAATKAERDTAQASLEDATRKVNALTDTLKKTTEERDKAQNELAAWKALGIPLDQIRATLASLKTVTEERDAIEIEKKILQSKVVRLDNKLKSLLDQDYVVPLPEGLKGKVLVTDPRYDFVVLDIGEKQGVLEDGQMLVNRNGKLIAKIRIKSVQPDRCIANVMPGWKIEDVMEGDQVLY
jgi:hypothetical protein